jgi:predicted nucleic-acid-binding protein
VDGAGLLYSVDRAGVADVVSGLLNTEQLRVESAEFVWRPKRRYETSKAEFSAMLHARDAYLPGYLAVDGLQSTPRFDPYSGHPARVP